MRERKAGVVRLVISAVTYVLAAILCLVSMALLVTDENALMLVTLLLAIGLGVFAAAVGRGGR
jgi:VIT1/CCC1 family predicted Fe2+/Mn2+ transporter